MSNILFTEKVHKVVSQIAKGHILSYQAVAKLAGSPRACRAVGNIMHTNSDPKKYSLSSSRCQ